MSKKKRKAKYKATSSNSNLLADQVRRQNARNGAECLENKFTVSRPTVSNGFGQPSDKRPGEIVSKPVTDYITTHHVDSSEPKDKTDNLHIKNAYASVRSHKHDEATQPERGKRKSNVIFKNFLTIFEKRQLVNLLKKRKDEVAFDLAELNSEKMAYLPKRIRLLRIARLEDRIAMYNDVINDIRNQ